MDKPASVCWFDCISDDILLHILSFVPKLYWSHLRSVNQRFRNIAADKDIFRCSSFRSAYGLKESDLQDYIRIGSKHVVSLNLNHCCWLTSTTLANFIPRCKHLQHLYLLDCKLTIKGLSKIICSVECLKTLVITVTNMIEFSNEINSNTELQSALVNLRHFGLHIREESNRNLPNSLQFHLSQQTTVIEYCPNLESFCVLGLPGSSHPKSKRLIHPLIVKTQNMSKLKSMSINGTNDATSRLYFFGILVKAFEAGVHFQNLSVSGLDLKQAVKKSYFIRALTESCPTLETLDLSKVLIDELESSISIDDVRCLRYLNLSDVRSESSSIGLMRIASKCPNLVSLNLRGATSGHRYWGTDELRMLEQVLRDCPNLQNINLTGVHVHGTDQSKQLLPIIVKNKLQKLKSIAFPVCALVGCVTESKSKQDSFVSKGFGKRQRIARQPIASTSSAALDVEMSNQDLRQLSEVCPHLTAIEIINSNFTQTVVLGSHKSLYEPCKNSFQIGDDDLSLLAKFTQLQYLQIIGVPGITSGKALREIGTNCVHLQKLSIAYVGLGTAIPHVWDSLQYFTWLKDLRIEQPNLKLDTRLYESCFKSKGLQRLTIVSKNSKITEPKVLENYVQEAKDLYLIQVFSDSTIKDCERIQSVLQKRFEPERPGFLATVEQLLHERVLNMLGSLPIQHFEEMTLLTSSVCSTPKHSVWGEP